MNATTNATVKTLLVIDRATGEVERIREDDPNFLESVKQVAWANGISVSAAMDVLKNGCHLQTAGFIRHLEAA